ncbi:MAG TPA: sn-glycerol-1-phosphate dehydrogenase [Anaerolineaceae bacterium]
MNTTQPDFPIYIGTDAIAKCCEFCQGNGLTNIYMVCDTHTYLALGDKVKGSLTAQGIDVKVICLNDDDLVADESTLVQVLLQVGEEERPFLAVGSGTITDITRYVSYVTRIPFISLPTAPSVDGYTSMNAPLVIQRVKQTIKAHGPMAVFADLNTLCGAPRQMIAAGFGDMLGKLTALADWKLAHLLMEEPYDDEVAQRAARALQSCIEHVDEIGKSTKKGIRILMDGLIETGLCMLKVGLSHPASGSEHHLSHYWEMKLLLENRPAILHGAKVGVATAIMAGYYADFGQKSTSEMKALITQAHIPDREAEINRINGVFGDMAGQIIEFQQPYLSLTPTLFEAYKEKILSHWPEIIAVAESVPSPETIRKLISAVGGPTLPDEIGLGDEDVRLGLRNAYCLRSHFTILTFRHLLGW